jgi:hypothetical protein
MARFNPQPNVAANALDSTSTNRANALRAGAAGQLPGRQPEQAGRSGGGGQRRLHQLPLAAARAAAAHGQRAAVPHELHLRAGVRVGVLLVPRAAARGARCGHAGQHHARAQGELGVRAAVRAGPEWCR